MAKTWHYKLVLLGDTAVGKSCLVVRFVRDEFFEFQEPTIGAAFLTQPVALDDATVKFEIWDTAGQEKFRSVTRTFFRNAACALVVYDISNRASFDHVSMWLEECRASSSNEHLVIVLIGNKVDLSPTRRRVSRQEGEELAQKYGVLFQETSAKTGENVDRAFLLPAEQICELVDSEEVMLESKRNSGITIERKEVTQVSGSGKCC